MIEVAKEDLMEILASWEEASQYKGTYLLQKHGDAEEIGRFRKKYL